MIRVVQHRHKCIGCNACVEADAFRWRISRKDGKSVLIGGKEKRGWYSVLVDDDEEQALHQAATHCPVNIIRFEKL
jgi:ferredoxin